MIGGAAIPALVGLQQMTGLGINSRWFAVASIVVSFVVAVSAGARRPLQLRRNLAGKTCRSRTDQERRLQFLSVER